MLRLLLKTGDVLALREVADSILKVDPTNHEALAALDRAATGQLAPLPEHAFDNSGSGSAAAVESSAPFSIQLPTSAEESWVRSVVLGRRWHVCGTEMTSSLATLFLHTSAMLLAQLIARSPRVATRPARLLFAVVEQLNKLEGQCDFADSVSAWLQVLEAKWTDACAEFSVALEAANAAERASEAACDASQGNGDGDGEAEAADVQEKGASVAAPSNPASAEKVRTTRSRSAPASQAESKAEDEGWDALPSSCQAILQDSTLNLENFMGESQQAKEAAAAASVPMAAACMLGDVCQVWEAGVCAVMVKREEGGREWQKKNGKAFP